jgi:hypothetical protein
MLAKRAVVLSTVALVVAIAGLILVGSIVLAPRYWFPGAYAEQVWSLSSYLELSSGVREDAPSNRLRPRHVNRLSTAGRN